MIMNDYKPEDIFESLPDDVAQFLELTVHRGFRLCLVGGAVRDYLRQGLLGTDLDFEVRHIDNTSLLAQLEKLAKDFNGEQLAFGIVRIKLGNYEVELAPPRVEHFLKNNHSHKNFTVDIDSSLEFSTSFKRRDFTINAIGVDYTTKQLVDPFNGQSALKNKILTQCSDDFVFDPVRFLRAMRFHVFFGYQFSDSLKLVFENMNLGELTEHYFVYESVKSCDLFKFFNVFFNTIDTYQVPLNIKIASLSFLRAMNSREPLLNLDQFLVAIVEKIEEISEDQLLKICDVYHLKKKEVLQFRNLVYFLSEFDEQFLVDLKTASLGSDWESPLFEIAAEVSRLINDTDKHHKAFHFLRKDYLETLELLRPIFDQSNGVKGQVLFNKLTQTNTDKTKWRALNIYCHLKEVFSGSH